VPLKKNQWFAVAAGLVTLGLILVVATVVMLVNKPGDKRTTTVALAADSSTAPVPVSTITVFVSGSTATPSPAVSKHPKTKSPSPKPKHTTQSPTPKATPSPTKTVPAIKTPTSADGRCIQLPASTINGAKVSAAKCDGSTAQKWIVTQNVFKNEASGKCLDFGGNGGADINFQIQLWDCNMGAAQIYTHRSDGTLYSPRADRCLTIRPDSDGGPALAVLPCTTGTNARWKLPS
jgi:hypothetical protein